MPNERISDMPDPVEVPNVSVLPIVVFGANWKCSKTEFLSAAHGDAVALVSRFGEPAQLQDSAGLHYVQMQGSDSKTFATSITLQTSAIFQPSSLIMNNVGYIVMTSGTQMELHAMGDQCKIIAGPYAFGASWQIISLQPIFISYFPHTPTDWSGFQPTDLTGAVDRCAALLKVLNGGVGP